MTTIHSSPSYASISPVVTGAFSGRPVTQASSVGGFLAFLKSSSAGQTSDGATPTPGFAKKDASPKGSGNWPGTTALPLANLPAESDSNSSPRPPLALSSATEQSESSEVAGANGGNSDEAPSVVTDGHTDSDTESASLNTLLSQTIIYPAAVPQGTVGNQLQVKAGFAFTANRVTADRFTASSTKVTAPIPAQAVPGNLSASTGMAPLHLKARETMTGGNTAYARGAATSSSASTQTVSNQTAFQTTPTQPDTPQPTSGQTSVAADPAAVREGCSALQPEIAAGTDGLRAEVSTTPTGDPRGELAFALRLRNTEPPAGSGPVNEAPGELPATDPGGTAPRTGLSMVELHNSEPAKTPDTKLVSPASARLAHTSEAAAPSQANNGTQSRETGSGANHSSDPGSHQPGNRDAAASSNAASADPQRITAGADSTSIHSQGVVATGAIPGEADVSAATAPKMPAAAATSSPAASETLTASAPLPVAEDNPVVGPAQPISISVSSGNDQKVEIRLMERAGEILVSVRTPDQTLAHSLRDDLGSLTGKLNQSGYNTEAFAPPGSASSNLSDRRSDKHGASDDRESGGGQRQNSGQRGSGDERQSRQEGRGKRPAWLEELNHSMASRQPNRSNSWQRQ